MSNEFEKNNKECDTLEQTLTTIEKSLKAIEHQVMVEIPALFYKHFVKKEKNINPLDVSKKGT